MKGKTEMKMLSNIISNIDTFYIIFFMIIVLMILFLWYIPVTKYRKAMDHNDIKKATHIKDTVATVCILSLIMCLLFFIIIPCIL